MDHLQPKKINVFDIIPAGFFNYLASNSNQRLYAECLTLIYRQYEREISYRIPRNQIRDSLAIYLLENHVSLDAEQETGPIKTHGELASAILRKLCSKNVGWLEEENDEATYEKQILMTERGILLAEFLAQLKKPEKEEYSGYIFDIYNTLRNEEQWAEHPYVNGLKRIYQNARYLSKSLKRLSTFIRKVIEKMVNEETLESLTENLLEYFDGSFIREYSRLTKQQNIHIYRGYIKARLDEMKEDTALLERLTLECRTEEELEEAEAGEQVEDMILASRRFLTEDYDRIMKVIKHKINVYLQVAIGRARFLRNREIDERGNIEQTIRYIVEEMRELDWKEGLPEKMYSLFTFGTQEFIDRSSLRYPRKQRAVRQAAAAELQEMTPEDIESSRRAQEKEAYNPYSKDRMKEYLLRCMGEREILAAEDMPFQDKEDLLAALSSVVYAEENGFEVIPAEGYLETNRLLIRRFEVVRREEDEH
ncbi:MAG: DUF5716 family protein [Firmicutes bacterium]|nr:DUF5716 family protein [Bacillota bacterium]